jgi:GNAT superfamily N-acetyltransferase
VPGSPGRSTEFPDLVGDLVFDRPEQLGPAQRAAVQQAIAELLENRTYGDGFTVRVRSVEIGRGSTHFEIAVFSGSREVGLTQHTVRWDGDVLVAHHSLIDVGGVRGRGFGRDWTEHLERWFRASGVDHITLHAVRAGTYAWARLGYRWVDEGQARQILDWLQTLTSGPDTTPSEVAAARELLDRAARFPWGHDRFPTIAEITEIGRIEPRPGLEHVEHLGRRTLTIGWYGRKDLR